MITEDGSENVDEVLDNCTVVPLAPAALLTVTVHDVVLPGSNTVETQLSPLTEGSSEILTEPDVVVTGMDAALADAPRAFATPIAALPTDALDASETFTVASVPFVIIFELIPSAIQI